ncbi:MAG: hypothetical protein ACLP1X_29915, partial [Polyangiaceae bacterium]
PTGERSHRFHQSPASNNSPTSSGRSAGGGWGKSRPARTPLDELPAEPAERGAPPAAEHRPDDGGRS